MCNTDARVGSSSSGGTPSSLAKALNLRFGSVDVLLTPDGPTVLEVNAGLMMEFVSRAFADGPAIADGIYGKAFDAMFGA